MFLVASGVYTKYYSTAVNQLFYEFWGLGMLYWISIGMPPPHAPVVQVKMMGRREEEKVRLRGKQ